MKNRVHLTLQFSGYLTKLVTITLNLGDWVLYTIDLTLNEKMKINECMYVCSSVTFGRGRAPS